MRDIGGKVRGGDISILRFFAANTRLLFLRFGAKAPTRRPRLSIPDRPHTEAYQNDGVEIWRAEPANDLLID